MFFVGGGGGETAILNMCNIQFQSFTLLWSLMWNKMANPPEQTLLWAYIWQWKFSEVHESCFGLGPVWIMNSPKKRNSLATHTPHYAAVPGLLGSRTLWESTPLLPLRNRCRHAYDISPTCQIPRRENTNVEKMSCINWPCQWVLMNF